MSDLLTREQIKEFWEWCGFETINYLDTSDKVCATHYVSPDKSWGKSWFPPIDLNNLFKYAVPTLSQSDIEFDMTFSEDTGGRMCEVTIKPFYEQNQVFGKEVLYYYRDYDPALALFWAIWRAMEAVKKEVEDG